MTQNRWDHAVYSLIRGILSRYSWVWLIFPDILFMISVHILHMAVALSFFSLGSTPLDEYTAALFIHFTVEGFGWLSISGILWIKSQGPFLNGFSLSSPLISVRYSWEVEDWEVDKGVLRFRRYSQTVSQDNCVSLHEGSGRSTTWQKCDIVGL